MRYILKQKILAFGDDFEVQDEHGRRAFFFDSKVGGFTRKIVVYGSNGEQVAIIRKKLLTFRPTFILYRDNREVARIYKKLLSFRRSFVIDVPGPNDITVVGRFSEHSYNFYRDGREIAEVSKKWFRSKDTYGVEIANSSDALLVLTGAVIIDIMCHTGRDSSF